MHRSVDSYMNGWTMKKVWVIYCRAVLLDRASFCKLHLMNWQLSADCSLFFFFFPHLDVCRMMYELKVESFSELTEIQIFKEAWFMTSPIVRSQSWSNIQLPQVWCSNLNPPVHKHWGWTLQWSRRHLVSSC